MRIDNEGLKGKMGDYSFDELKELLHEFLTNKEYDLSGVEETAESEEDVRSLSIAKMASDFMRKYELKMENYIGSRDSVTNLIVNDVTIFYDSPERLF